MTDRDRRAIARGTVTVVIAFGLLRGAPAVASWVGETEARTSASRALLQRQVAMWGSRDSLEAAIRASEERLADFEELVLPVDTEIEGVEWLSDRAREVLAANSVRFARLEHLVDSTDALVRTATIALEMTGDERTLLATVRGFDSQPMIALRSLELRPTSEPSADPLRARIVVEGYYLQADTVGAVR